MYSSNQQRFCHVEKDLFFFKEKKQAKEIIKNSRHLDSIVNHRLPCKFFLGLAYEFNLHYMRQNFWSCFQSSDLLIEGKSTGNIVKKYYSLHSQFKLLKPWKLFSRHKSTSGYEYSQDHFVIRIRFFQLLYV